MLFMAVLVPNEFGGKFLCYIRILYNLLPKLKTYEIFYQTNGASYAPFFNGLH